MLKDNTQTTKIKFETSAEPPEPLLDCYVFPDPLLSRLDEIITLLKEMESLIKEIEEKQE